MAAKLGAEDVQKLLSDPSAENRAATAEKLAEQFASPLSDSEKSMAEEIFRIMVKDAEERVRLALAENLKDAHGVPSDVAASLAKDVSDSVALPIIQFSDALEENDLVEIARSQGAGRQVAVAGRPDVSDQIASAIVSSGNEDAVVTLVANENAEMSEKTLDQVVENFGDSERVQEPLVKRPTLPVGVAEKLVAKVSDQLKDYLVTHHELSEETAADLILQSRERATIGLSGAGADAEALVRELQRNGRLTPSIILRAICCGDSSFFEAGIAVMADVPVVNARELIHDPGPLGLKSIYQKAGLPMGLYPAYRAAVDAFHSSELERTDDGPERRMRRLLERVLTEHEEIVDEYGIDNVDYLVAKFNTLGGAVHAV